MSGAGVGWLFLAAGIIISGETTNEETCPLTPLETRETPADLVVNVEVGGLSVSLDRPHLEGSDEDLTALRVCPASFQPPDPDIVCGPIDCGPSLGSRHSSHHDRVRAVWIPEASGERREPVCTASDADGCLRAVYPLGAVADKTSLRIELSCGTVEEFEVP